MFFLQNYIILFATRWVRTKHTAVVKFAAREIGERADKASRIVPSLHSKS